MEKHSILEALDALIAQAAEAIPAAAEAAIAVAQAERLVAAARTQAIIEGASAGALDGKNESERKLREASWMAGREDVAAAEALLHEREAELERAKARCSSLRFSRDCLELVLQAINGKR